MGIARKYTKALSNPTQTTHTFLYTFHTWALPEIIRVILDYDVILDDGKTRNKV